MKRAHRNLSISWLSGKLEVIKRIRWIRKERKKVISIIWPGRWLWYGFLLATGMALGTILRIWHDFSFAFQCGRIVGGME